MVNLATRNTVSRATPVAPRQRGARAIRARLPTETSDAWAMLQRSALHRACDLPHRAGRTHTRGAHDAWHSLRSRRGARGWADVYRGERRRGALLRCDRQRRRVLLGGRITYARAVASRETRRLHDPLEDCKRTVHRGGARRQLYGRADATARALRAERAVANRFQLANRVPEPPGLQPRDLRDEHGRIGPNADHELLVRVERPGLVARRPADRVHERSAGPIRADLRDE